MTTRGEAIAERARALVGTRFRPQGRDPAFGLDCIGTAALAVQVPLERLRRDYALRGSSFASIVEGLDQLGFERVADQTQAGDIVVMEAGPAQLHVAVCTGRGFVHADARLRKVVERPAPLPWRVLGVWREAGDR